MTDEFHGNEMRIYSTPHFPGIWVHVGIEDEMRPVGWRRAFQYGQKCWERLLDERHVESDARDWYVFIGQLRLEHHTHEFFGEQ